MYTEDAIITRTLAALDELVTCREAIMDQFRWLGLLITRLQDLRSAHPEETQVQVLIEATARRKTWLNDVIQKQGRRMVPDPLDKD